jgi:hypothetical protein
MPAREAPWFTALAPIVERDDLTMEISKPFLTPSGGRVDAVPSVFARFAKWDGQPFVDDFGKKTAAMVALDGEHVFAELAIVRLLERDGWDARWVNTTSGRGEVWKYLTEWRDAPRTEQTSRPIRDDKARLLIAAIADKTGNRFAGCWDVFAWRGEQYAFLQAKRQTPKDRDRVPPSQEVWVRAALSLRDTPLTPESFGLVQWEYAKTAEPQPVPR